MKQQNINLKMDNNNNTDNSRQEFELIKDK